MTPSEKPPTSAERAAEECADGYWSRGQWLHSSQCHLPDIDWQRGVDVFLEGVQWQAAQVAEAAEALRLVADLLDKSKDDHATIIKDGWIDRAVRKALALLRQEGKK